MKRYTATLFLMLITAALQSMQSSDITLSCEEHKQQALIAKEYNKNNPFPDEIFKIIFSYCKKENDIMYIPALERNTYTGEAKSALITYSQILTLLSLSRTCQKFNTLMPLQEIIAFCKTLPSTIKDNTLKITIPNISKNYDISKWICPEIYIPKFNNNYDNNLICLRLLHAGANPNIKFQLTDKIKLSPYSLSVISQAVDDNPLLVASALKHGANPNAKDNKGIPLFFYAKTIEMANLFLINKCHIHGKEGKSANNTNVIWHILNKDYPPQLITFYRKHDVNILKGGRTCIVHNLIDLLEDYVDYGLADEFLEKCRILLEEILEPSKNRIHENCTLLDELEKQFDRVEIKGKEVQAFKKAAIKLFKDHGCKTAYNFIDEQHINEAIQHTNDLLPEQQSSISLEDSILLHVLKQSIEEIPITVKIHDSLMKPVKDKNINVVRTLLEKIPLNINEQDNIGNTLLIWSVINKDYKMTQLLLNYGANPNISSSIGRTALDFAIENGNNEIATLLFDASENYNDC